MNRLDPRLEATTRRRVLDSLTLAGWSLEGFGLARKLARAPLGVTGGFKNARLILGLPSGHVEQADIVIPVEVDGFIVDMALSSDALDSLVTLLDGRSASGAGRTLSFDAIEALMAGLLAPLGFDGVGRARPAGGTDTELLPFAMAALHVEGADIPLLGSDGALHHLHTRVEEKMDRLVAAPLSYLKSPVAGQVAMEVETLIGAALLDDNERSMLEPGGGVVLDAYWPSGITVVGRRFVATQTGWRTDESLSEMVLVRRAVTLRGLDDPSLGSEAPTSGQLELVDGQSILADGRIAQLDQEDGPQPIFVLDPPR